MSKHSTAKSLDLESRAMLYEGCNLSQLSIIFGLDHRDLVRKIHGLEPVGQRGGVNIYRIRDVAPRMWKPSEEQIEKAMRTMHHNDLPKLLTKEYWNGLRSRQEYELRAGELWPTAKVVEKVGELMKLVKMQTTLMSDAVERSTELTPRQRKIIKALTNGMLDDLQKEVVKHFSKKEPVDVAEEDHVEEELDFDFDDDEL